MACHRPLQVPCVAVSVCVCARARVCVQVVHARPARARASSMWVGEFGVLARARAFVHAAAAAARRAWVRTAVRLAASAAAAAAATGFTGTEVHWRQEDGTTAASTTAARARAARKWSAGRPETGPAERPSAATKKVPVVTARRGRRRRPRREYHLRRGRFVRVCARAGALLCLCV